MLDTRECETISNDSSRKATARLVYPLLHLLGQNQTANVYQTRIMTFWSRYANKQTVNMAIIQWKFAIFHI